MRLTASLKIASEAAYDNRIQFGAPKAAPVTEATLASSSRNKEKSLASLMCFPLIVFPKKYEISGKT